MISESSRDTSSEHSGNDMYHFLYVQNPNFTTDCIYVLHMILIVKSEHKVCSDSIWIGIVVVVHWVACICSQS